MMGFGFMGRAADCGEILVTVLVTLASPICFVGSDWYRRDHEIFQPHGCYSPKRISQNDKDHGNT